MIKFYYDAVLGLVWWDFKSPSIDGSKKRKKSNNKKTRSSL